MECKGIMENSVITKVQSFQNSIQIVYLTILLFLSEMLFC